MTTSIATPSKALHCSCCGAERKPEDLKGVNLTSTGWNDDSKAYCRHVADCQSQEAGDVLDWVNHCLTVEDPDESINDLVPGDPLPEQKGEALELNSVRPNGKSLYGFNDTALSFGAGYEPRPADPENPELQTDPLHSSQSASSPAPDLHAVQMDQLTRASQALQQAEDSLALARSAVQLAIESAAPLSRVIEPES